MDLNRLTRDMISGQQAKARMQKAGTTMKGDKLWTDEEDDVLRCLYPNFSHIALTLPNRSRVALWARCRKLGLKKARHQWLANEISKLRRMYPNYSATAICAEFPGMLWINIRAVATYYGLRRNPRTHKRTGRPIMDGILSRIEDIGWTLKDLDEESGSGRYFQDHGWRRYRLNFNAIAKAVRALDGDLEISWKQYA